MRPTTTAVLIAINLLVQLYPVAHSQTEPIRTSARGLLEESYYSISLPAKDRLAPMARIPITVQGELLGEFVAYDDVTTARAADYLELYNNLGDLLAVSWFDRFGIERLALDQGLVQSTDKLEGTFVLVVTGNSI